MQTAGALFAAWDAALAHARRTRIADAAAAPPLPPPVPRTPGARGLLPGSPERQAFDRLLDALYPLGSREADKAGKADEAGRR